MRVSEAVDGFLLARRADGYSPHTIGDYGRTLRRMAEFLGDPTLEQVTSHDLRRFLAWLRDGYTPPRGGQLSPHTIANAWCAVRSFFRWAHAELDIERPDLTLQQPRYASPTIEPFTREEVARLLQAAEYTCAAKTAERRLHQRAAIGGDGSLGDVVVGRAMVRVAHGPPRVIGVQTYYNRDPFRAREVCGRCRLRADPDTGKPTGKTRQLNDKGGRRPHTGLAHDSLVLYVLLRHIGTGLYPLRRIRGR